MSYLYHLLELFLDLLEFLLSYWLVEKPLFVEWGNRTLGGDVMFRVEKDNIQLQRQGGTDIVTDWLGKVHGAQSLWTQVSSRRTKNRNCTDLCAGGIA